MRLLPILVMVLAFAHQTQAWWGKGHLLTARIAYDILNEKSPSTISKVNNILMYLQQTDASWTKKEGDHPMVECATFADDIKNKGGKYQQGWHFIDIPYLDQGGKITDYNFTFDAHNVTQAIGGITKWFTQAPNYQDEYAYQQIMEHRYNCSMEQCGLSTAMRLLIHYVGDIHQPLHCTSRVDHNYPQGDFGGNTVPIADNPEYPNAGVSNLHKVWDSILYEFQGYQDLPFSAADWKSFGDKAQEWMKKHPMDAAVINDLDPTHWAQESNKIAYTFVYAGVKEGEVIPDAYITQGRALAEKQIVTGGNRLANLLMTFPLDDWIARAQNGEAQEIKEEMLRILPMGFVEQHLNKMQRMQKKSYWN